MGVVGVGVGLGVGAGVGTGVGCRLGAKVGTAVGVHVGVHVASFRLVPLLRVYTFQPFRRATSIGFDTAEHFFRQQRFTGL